MMVRHYEIDFNSGALVFPGGSVDKGDREIIEKPELYSGGEGLDTAELSFRIAAIRETFEESGILLARLRVSFKNYCCGRVDWADGVVPVAVEFVAVNVDGVHLGVGDFDAGGINVGVDLAAHLEAGVGGGGRDQLDDGLVADERLAAPVLGDEREEAMLDLVPLAGAGRQMADRDGDVEFVGQALQLALPQPDPRRRCCRRNRR